MSRRSLKLITVPALTILIFLFFVSPAQSSKSAISGLTVSSLAFSPNGDGVKDLLAFRFRLSERATVSFSIFGGVKCVRKLLLPKKMEAGPKLLYWNGKNDSKKIVMDGKYRAVAFAKSAAGKLSLITYVKVDNTRPYLYSAKIAPNPFWPDGDGYKDAIKLNTRSNETATYSIKIFDQSGTKVYGKAKNRASTLLTMSWSGETGQGKAIFGNYSLEIKATDLAGNAFLKRFPIFVSPFIDISSLPESYRGAIVGLVEDGILKAHSNGVFSGDSKGMFHPLKKANRADLAFALAKAFEYENESPDPQISFKDISRGSFIFRYANLAVKKGLIKEYPDGEFKSDVKASDALVLSSLVKAKGLGTIAKNITDQDPTGSWYAGYCVIAHQLGLKYKESRTWPGNSFSRRELVWSVYKVRSIDRSKIDRITETFSKDRYTDFNPSALQNKFIKFAKKWIGYPYVWGGDSPTEGGFDCSGLMYYDYSSTFGFPIKRTAAMGAADSRYPKISFSELQPADLIYFWDEDRSRISHTGMYLGKGFFIHSSGSRSGVSIDIMDEALGPYWRAQFAWGRRIIPVIKVTDFSASPGFFSPNSDGSADIFSLSYRISKKALASLLISDQSGRVVWSKSQLQGGGARRLVWDGRRMDGELAQSGRYKFRLGFVDEEVNRKVMQGGLWLDLIAPSVNDIKCFPEGLDPRQTVRVTISYNLSERSYIEVTVIDASGKAIRTIETGSLKAAGPNQTVWNGKDSSGNIVSSGTYSIKLSLRDMALNKGKGSVLVQVK